LSGHRDLRLAVGAAALSAALALLCPWPLLALLFALPIALLLPGYAVMAAGFPRGGLTSVPILISSLALSLATLALGALPLNYVPGGVRGISWAIFLVAVVIAGCLVAARRRPPAGRRKPRRARRPRKLEALLVLGGLIATVAAVMLSQTAVSVDDARGYTQLWALPQEDAGAGVEVGVGNQSQHALAYYLTVRIGDEPKTSQRVELDPGEAQELQLPVPEAEAGAGVPVVATLVLASEPQDVYRRVKIAVPGPGPR
jgi:uncharacterized membrane protein